MHEDSQWLETRPIPNTIQLHHSPGREIRLDYSPNRSSRAAAVRSRLRAEQEAEELRATMAEYDRAPFLVNAEDGDTLRCTRTLDGPTYGLEEDKVIAYVFTRQAGAWYGTGRSAPQEASTEQLVDWLVDNDVDIRTFEFVVKWMSAAKQEGVQ